MRQDYAKFVDRNAEIIAISPDSAEKLRDHWNKEQIPYPGIPDPDKQILGELGQEFKLLKFGRMPGVIIVDSKGAIQHSHYGNNAGDIPETDTLLALIDELES